MYRIFNTPQLSDDAYDQLKLEHVRALRDNPDEASALTRARSIKEQITTFGQQTRHDFPVLDARKIQSLSQLKNWLDLVDSNTTILVTPNYVGVTIELVYVGGRLHKAVNRGDGIWGLDITAQAYLINGVPQHIPENERVSIRGIVTLPVGVTQDPTTVKATARALMSFNSESSTVKDWQEQLTFIPTETNIPGTTFSTMELRSILLAWDFYLSPHTTFKGNQKELGFLEETIDEFYQQLTNSHLEIDGLVFTVVSTQRKLELGYTSRYPEWNIHLEQGKPK